MLIILVYAVYAIFIQSKPTAATDVLSFLWAEASPSASSSKATFPPSQPVATRQPASWTFRQCNGSSATLILRSGALW